MNEPTRSDRPTEMSQRVKQLGPVPVFDCHVALSPPGDDGVIQGVCLSLPEITASGRSEREVLQKIAADFKAAVVRYRAAGGEIPWSKASAELASGWRQRWLPVHL